jgi:hypothetical protein
MLADMSDPGVGPFFKLPADNSDGFGVTYINNTAGLLSARAQSGIAVAGMVKVAIVNDRFHPLNVIPISFAPGAPAALCSDLIVLASVGDTSGTYPTPTGTF